MNHHLKGRTLMHGDIIKPETPIAEFSDAFSLSHARQLTAYLNYGHEMLMLYKQHRGDRQIESVAGMLEDMEEVFKEFDEEIYLIKRSGEKREN